MERGEGEEVACGFSDPTCFHPGLELLVLNTGERRTSAEVYPCGIPGLQISGGPNSHIPGHICPARWKE